MSEKILRDLTRNGRRARLKLIRQADGKLAVRKQFRPEHERYYRREVEALEALGKIDRHDVIPPVLARGTLSFTIPWYAELPAGNRLLRIIDYRVIPLPDARKIFFALQHFYNHGYEILDISPHNIMRDENAAVKIIDFEYAYAGAAVPTTAFEHSLTIRGPGPRPAMDSPRGAARRRNWYRSQWLPVTGLPLRSLLYNPPWKQQLKRTAILGAILPVRLGRMLIKRAGKRLLDTKPSKPDHRASR